MDKTLKKLADRAAQMDDQSKSYIPSYPCDEFLWLENAALDQLVDKIAGEIDGVSKRRKRDEATQEKFIFCLKIILLNFAKLKRLPVRTLLAVNKRAGAFTTKSRYAHSLFSYRPFIQAYDGLLTCGYVEIAKQGWKDRNTGEGEVTRIEATIKMNTLLEQVLPQAVIIFRRHPKEETIRLREEKKKGKSPPPLIGYEDTDYTRSARERLRRINDCLSRHWYDLDMAEDKFSELSERLSQRHKDDPKDPASVDFSARSLYRVFNNGSFDEGGRFYGAWWISVPSEYRRYITINQKYTVEVDYSNLHPAMMYAKKGQVLGRDAYAVDGIERALVKKAFAQLINGKAQFRTPEEFDEKAYGIKWKDVLLRVEERHEPIKEYFRSGYGLKLQRLDAEIAERIMLYFTNRDYPCLPVHDSFIIHHELEDELKERMLEEYRKELGMDAGLKTDNNYDFFVKGYNDQREDQRSIDEILLLDEQSQYERRWCSWIEQQDK